MTKRKQHKPDFKARVAEGRLLLLSPFASSDRRVTKDLAMERNRFVAAFADEVVFAHVTPGGHLDELRREVPDWGLPHGTAAARTS